MPTAFHKHSILSAAIFLAMAVRPFAQSTNSDLEDRVNKLEGNIDQILQILQQNQPASPAPNAAGPTSVATPTPAATASSQPTPQWTRAPGASLDVWVLRPDFSGSSPDGSPVGRFIDKGEYFALANFAKDRAFEGYKSSRVALRWAGYFSAEEAGTYVFTLEQQSQPTHKERPWGGGNSSGIWIAELALNSQTVVREAPQITNWKEASHTAVGQVELQPGLYEFTLTTFINPENPGLPRQWNYQHMRITAKVRTPKDSAPRALTEEDIFRKVE